MNRLCTCTGYGAGVAMLATLGVAVLTTMGFGGAPTGACCTGTTCSIETEADCDAGGGSYSGDDTDCANACGACCLPSGACEERQEAPCVLAGGNYQGDDTTCAADGQCGGCCYEVDPTACTIDDDCPTGETCVGNECTNTGGQTTCDGLTAADCAALTNSQFLGVGTNCNDCSFSNCTAADDHCQSPNIAQFPGGTILTASSTFDNFAVAAGTQINGVCFWGAYLDAANAVDCSDAGNLADNVQIRILSNQQYVPPGQPVTVIANRTNAQMTIQKRPTGLEFNLGGFDDPSAEYEWVATFNTPVIIPAASSPADAGCYWLWITNTVTSDLGADCVWYWEVSPEAVNDPDNGDGDDLSIDQVSQDDQDFEMAWCLNMTPPLNDVGDCYLPVVGGCEEGGGQGECNMANLTPGCNDPDCCTLVCTAKAEGGAGLAFCCFSPWIQACADAAIDFGCTPLPPCQPEENCQVLSTDNAFNSTAATLAADEQFISADDFTPLNTGSINTICWYGALVPIDPAEPPDNDFTVTYYADDDGKPGAILVDSNTNPASYNQNAAGNLALAGLEEKNSNLELPGGTDISVYSATHADVPVTAGECYWIEIKNSVGDPDAMGEASSWFWSWGATSAEAPIYSGNGRMALDGSPPDGYTDLDIVAATDLAFCLGMELSTPVCGLQTLYNTGPENVTLFDAADGGEFANIFLGWSSGNLCVNNSGGSVPCDSVNNAYPQRRTVQPFHLGPVAEGGGTDHRIRYIYVDGFEPDTGELNEDLNVAIYSRNGFDRPDENDLLYEGSFPFGAIVAVNNPEGGFALPSIFYANVDLALPGNADYWLTTWASNSSEGQLVASNFAWFTNAHDGIKISCDPDAAQCVGPTPEDAADTSVIGCNLANCALTAGDIFLWRSRHVPDGAPLDPAPADGFGFGTYNLDPSTTLAYNAVLDPNGSPDNLYSASFQLRGGPGGTCGNSVLEPGEECDPPGSGCSAICLSQPVSCPWDCDGSGDGFSNVSDLLQLLGEYDINAPGDCSSGTDQCDYDNNGCVDVVDLLKLLSHYSTLPAGNSCP